MSEWIFVIGKDSDGGDLFYSVNEPEHIPDDCVAFNTLGFYKKNISLPLVRSSYFSNTDGIYVRKDELYTILDGEEFDDAGRFLLEK